MPSPLGILGAGGQARELVGYLGPDAVEFFAVSAAYSTGMQRLIDIAHPTDAQRNTPVVAAVGAPALRRALVSQWSGDRFASYLAPTAIVGDSQLGVGALVAPGAVITNGVQIGSHAIINIGATVSHDVRAGDFVTVGPGAHIGGHCRLGNGVVVGIGAVLTNGISVADGVVIGAGAVVIGDVDDENAVVVGNPARRLRIAEGWADAL